MTGTCGAWRCHRYSVRSIRIDEGRSVSPVWYSRDGASAAGWAVTARESDEHASGAVVEAATSDAPVVWRSLAAARALIRVETPELADAPPLWFVHVDEPRAVPRATNLVAFEGDDVPVGHVIDHYRFASLGVPSERQVGAIRWLVDTATVHQIFVDPERRRAHTGSALIYAADALHQSKGWRGALHSDGRRTDLGQFFVAAQRHPERFAARTEVMPPMDPTG